MVWGRHEDIVVPQGTPSSQRPHHHHPKPALPGLAWEMGHAAAPGGGSPCPSLGGCGAAGDGGGTRAHRGPLRTAAPLQAGSAVTATRPPRLRSPHACTDREGAQPPGLRGRGLSPAGPAPGGSARPQDWPVPVATQPPPRAMCHAPAHAVPAAPTPGRWARTPRPWPVGGRWEGGRRAFTIPGWLFI